MRVSGQNVHVWGNYPDACGLCWQFSAEGPLKYSWKSIESLHGCRISAACAVYEEKVVVSGGSYYRDTLNTVEAYDAAADKWTRMPSMIEKRHKLVVVRDKLFVGLLRVQSVSILTS